MTGPTDDDTRTTTDERLFFRVSKDDATFEIPEVMESPGRLAPQMRRRRIGIPKIPDRKRFGRSLRAALEREQGLGTAFLFVPVGLLAGIMIYFALAREPAPWNVPAGIIVLAMALLVARHGSPAIRLVLLAGFLVVAGMALAQAHTAWRATPMLGSDVTTRLTGRIVALEERANGRTRFTIDVVKTERPVLRYAPRRVRVTAPGSAQGFAMGGGIHGLVRLTSPSGPAHVGGYDFAFHSYFKGIGANGFFLGRPEAVVLAENPAPIQRAAISLQKLRHAIGREILLASPDRSGAVSAALVTGNKSGIPEDVTEALRVSGLAHILSISGLHMALVAATVMAGLRLGFAFAPGWSARHPVRKYAAAGALAATAFYLFLAGAGVATQRSFVMLAIMLLALTFDRNAVTMRNLALAGIAVMAVAPHEVAGPGFQMSFAATAALIAVYGGWRDWRHRREYRHIDRGQRSPIIAFMATAARYALGIGLTSLIAGLATGLFASYHFGRVAPYGLLANLAAMPLVTILVMPLAVAAVVAIPFGLHTYLFKAMAWAVELVITIAEWVAALSPALPTGQMPASVLLIFSTGLILACLLSTRLKVAAIPVFVLGAGMWAIERHPVAVLSEDARQFAVVENTGEGMRLHVNRERPNAFIVDQWRAAYRAATVVKPDQSDLFDCNEKQCSASVGMGRIRIGYVLDPLEMPAEETDPPTLGETCRTYDLVVLAKAPSPQTCPDGTLVITAQMLARRGAAEIYHQNGTLRIVHVLPGPQRPWLDHRRYSRAARNLAEWRRSQ